MLTISTDQYERLNKIFARQRRVRLFRRLRREEAIAPETTDEEAIGIVDRAIEEGAVIEIDQDEDILDLCRLIFARLDGRIDRRRAELIGTVLSNVSTPALERMTFVRNSIMREGSNLLRHR